MKTDRNSFAPQVFNITHAVFVCLFFIFPIVFSCTTNKVTDVQTSSSTVQEVAVPTQIVPDSILMTFGGDIMAHNVNFNMKDYNLIYEDVSALVSQSDLSFANLETPVDDDRPFSTYPNFNVKHTYPDAAIRAGFNVFSLANNHTNDQSLPGIKATKSYFDGKILETEKSERPVYACGLKASKDGPLTYQIIKKKNWTILFVAITEILNSNIASSYVDLIRPNEKARARFIEEITKLKHDNPCDLFVMSIHCSEPEYIISVSKSQRDWYYRLLDAGVDIIWANHPHVAKKWEVVGNSNDKVPQKIIFYALGNTISGQRYNPEFKNASNPRENTGDGFLIQVRYERTQSGHAITLVNPVLITTYINTAWNFVIKKLDDSFISQLTTQKRTDWAAYLEERKKIMENIKGTIIWR